MKTIQSLPCVALLVGTISFATTGCKTADNDASASVKPYTSNKCLVTDEPLESGKTYTFVKDGQQIKLCCKDCLADFDKDPAKYLAKLSNSK